MRQGAFAGAVGPHDGVHLTGADGQIDTLQDRGAIDLGMQIYDFQKRHDVLPRGPQPTLPSNEIPISFCASTANSIGSSFITSLQKPLTISDTASSSLSPRCRQ